MGINFERLKMIDEQQKDVHSTTILKELSDIKANLAVNSNETANIKASISEIKSDMKEIKNDFVNRREFNEALKAIREEFNPNDKESRIRSLERFRWLLMGGLAAFQSIADYILYLMLKK